MLATILLVAIRTQLVYQVLRIKQDIFERETRNSIVYSMVLNQCNLLHCLSLFIDDNKDLSNG